MSASILEVQKHWNVKYTTTNAFFGHGLLERQKNCHYCHCFDALSGCRSIQLHPDAYGSVPLK